MLKNDEKSLARINKAFSMPDSDEKLDEITRLQLETEPLTPLHMKLIDEGNRLLDAGFFWKQESWWEQLGNRG